MHGHTTATKTPFSIDEKPTVFWCKICSMMNLNEQWEVELSLRCRGQTTLCCRPSAAQKYHPRSEPDLPSLITPLKNEFDIGMFGKGHKNKRRISCPIFAVFRIVYLRLSEFA